MVHYWWGNRTKFCLSRRKKKSIFSHLRKLLNVLIQGTEIVKFPSFSTKHNLEDVLCDTHSFLVSLYSVLFELLFQTPSCLKSDLFFIFQGQWRLCWACKGKVTSQSNKKLQHRQKGCKVKSPFYHQQHASCLSKEQKESPLTCTSNDSLQIYPCVSTDKACGLPLLSLQMR